MNRLTATMLASLFASSSLYAAKPPAAQTTPAGCNCATQFTSESYMLTPAQRNKIQAIMAESNESIRTIQLQLDVVRQQIDALIHTERLDEKSLDILSSQQASLFARRLKARAIASHRIYNVLTPAQKTHFNQIYHFWKLNNQGVNQLDSL